jgi:hypothetical protein
LAEDAHQPVVLAHEISLARQHDRRRRRRGHVVLCDVWGVAPPS